MPHHALQKDTLLYSLGMGCLDRPLPRMLNSRNWSLATTSFYFRCLRPGRVLHELVCLRTHPGLNFALDTGGGGGGGALLFSTNRHRRLVGPGISLSPTDFRQFAKQR